MAFRWAGTTTSWFLARYGSGSGSGSAVFTKGTFQVYRTNSLQSLNVIANAFDIEAARSGFGRHAHFLKYHQLVTAGKYAQMAVCVAAIAVWATKTSICFFLLGIIKRTHIVFFWCIWILMGFTTVTSFIGVLLWGLQAKPLPKLWDPTVPGTRDSPQGFLDVVYVHYGDSTPCSPSFRLGD